MKWIASFLLALSLFAAVPGDVYAQGPVKICVQNDPNNPNQCVPVDREQTYPVSYAKRANSTPTVQNASYSSGNCIGGFNALTVANINGQTGFVTNVRIASVSGQTPTITVYLFSANPNNSTCTDKSTFTLSASDLSKLIASPDAVTLAAPTGSTASFGKLDFVPPRPFIAGGGLSEVKTIYYGLVSGSTFTPGSTTDIRVTAGVALN